MDLETALARQYRAALAMLRQCVDRCPDDLWTDGPHPRATWRIAYHAVLTTHLYLSVEADAFTPWERHRDQVAELWGNPPVETPYSRTEILSYIDDVSASVGEALAEMDLSAPQSGFSWYPLSKVEHQLVNLRHLGGHVGQLSERLMARGIETDWVGSVRG